jgi:hypothetical protein
MTLTYCALEVDFRYVCAFVCLLDLMHGAVWVRRNGCDVICLCCLCCSGLGKTQLL